MQEHDRTFLVQEYLRSFTYAWIMSISVKNYNNLYIHVEQLKITSLSMPTENSLWHAKIGIFNMNRTYIKKIKLPSLPLTNCHFSVLSVSFFIIKPFFLLKLPKLLLLICYILAMYSLIFSCCWWFQCQIIKMVTRW